MDVVASIHFDNFENLLAKCGCTTGIMFFNGRSQPLFPLFLSLQYI